MATPVYMPRLGKWLEKGILRRWLVDEGDEVHPYQPIAEIAFAKVDREVVAPVAGVLIKQCYPPGAEVPARRPIALIGEPDEPIPETCNDI